MKLAGRPGCRRLWPGDTEDVVERPLVDIDGRRHGDDEGVGAVDDGGGRPAGVGLELLLGRQAVDDVQHHRMAGGTPPSSLDASAWVRCRTRRSAAQSMRDMETGSARVEFSGPIRLSAGVDPCLAADVKVYSG